jgi:uncharacterized membrane protein (DUF106 family)
MSNKRKETSFKGILIMMLAAFVIAGLWDAVPAIKNSIHYVLDPTLGVLLNWNLDIGMLIIIFFISLITTLVQKYATDQKALAEMKKEQKDLQEEMKVNRENPQKMMELQKKSFEFLPKTMKLSFRAVTFTAIPFLLFFKWFMDYFATVSHKFFGFMGWFWFYFVFAMIFSSILKKVLKVV